MSNRSDSSAYQTPMANAAAIHVARDPAEKEEYSGIGFPEMIGIRAVQPGGGELQSDNGEVQPGGPISLCATNLGALLIADVVHQ